MSSFKSKYQNLLWFLLLLYTCKLSAQPAFTYNRFQYHKYKWQSFHTKAFHVYFPTGYDSLGSFIAREWPMAIKKVKHNMGTAQLKPCSIIIYPSIDQQYESNIGLYETDAYPFPTFLAKGNRMVLAYTGDNEDLKRQLYTAIARSIWEAQLQEGAEQIKRQLNKDAIPFWFKEGAIQYFATGWTIEAEDALKSAFVGFKR